MGRRAKIEKSRARLHDDLQALQRARRNRDELKRPLSNVKRSLRRFVAALNAESRASQRGEGHE
jgi:hypothetical protein